MKRVCKKVDITSESLIRKAVLACLKPCKKRQRSDTRQLFKNLLGISSRLVRRSLRERDDLFYRGVELIVSNLREKIKSENLSLKKIYYQNRHDPASGKIREIAILSIEQLLLDHVAVIALEELSKRIGEYQVSSIPKRGASYGKKALQKWLRGKKCKYATKLDIKKFYGSVDKTKLLDWLRKRIKNAKLIWLIESLLTNNLHGIPIGSYLSQTLANIFLSDLYHLAMERCVNKRGKRQIKHALFYMDDMLFISNNKRQLRYAVLTIISRANELGLEVKKTWSVFKIEERRPIVMMGYRFSFRKVTLRKRNFKMIRRHAYRAKNERRRGKPTCLTRALKLASYYGYTKGVNCVLYMNRSNAGYFFRQAFGKISRHTRFLNKRYNGKI